MNAFGIWLSQRIRITFFSFHMKIYSSSNSLQRSKEYSVKDGHGNYADKTAVGLTFTLTLIFWWHIQVFENNKGCQNIFHNKLLHAAHVQDQHSFLPSWCTSCYQDIIWLLRCHCSSFGSLPSHNELKHCPSLSLYLLACTVSCILTSGDIWEVEDFSCKGNQWSQSYQLPQNQGRGRQYSLCNKGWCIMPLGRL